VTPATVHNIEHARLRRAIATGEPSLVLEAVEAALSVAQTSEERTAAHDAFYAVFWVAAEDAALQERVGAIDLRIARERCPE
jgi:hypothetical protein